MGDLALALAVSRPYYWLVTMWLYLLPTGGRAEVFGMPAFWLGAAYCTLPLNLLAYLMNDLADVRVDAANERKGGSLLGAKASSAALRRLVLPTALLQLGFAAAFAPLCGGVRVIAPWLGCVVCVNWAYNFGPRLSSRFAPLDLVCPCGYLLVTPLSCWLTGLPYPAPRCWAHAVFLVLRTQLWISTFDIDTDAAAGRRNTAVVLGMRGSQALLAALLLGESAFVWRSFSDWALRSFSTASVALLAAQVALQPARGAARLSARSVNATFGVLGLGGVGLMAQVWVNGAFVT